MSLELVYRSPKSPLIAVILLGHGKAWQGLISPVSVNPNADH